VSFIGNLLIAKQILAPVLAFMVSFFAMPIIIRIAVKKELVAKPNHRTSHKGRIPNIGGVSIFIGFTIALLFAVNISLYPSFQYFLLGLIFMFFIGLRDDILILSARKKFLGEIIAILAFVVLGDIRITNLHNFFGIGEIHYTFSILLSVLVCLVIINALNLIDGIDGLASGIGIIASLFFGICFLLIGNVMNNQLAIVALSLFGALVPFFIYNVFGTRNKIFMGDAGALCLGFIIALLSIEFCEVNLASTNLFNLDTAPIIVVSVLILPLFDTFRVFIIRMSQGKSPFKPDKNHLHHNLLALGFTHKKATSILLGFTGLFIAISLLGNALPRWVLLVIIVGLAVIFSEFLKIKLKNKQTRERNIRMPYNPHISDIHENVIN
jgi:UDP-N-acetylmuramyl pentapeptide phosphotransferase/UDP-N-acetylglucosamine-1-phosphate transferase